MQFGWKENPRKGYSIPVIEVTWTHKLFNVFRHQETEKKRKYFVWKKTQTK